MAQLNAIEQGRMKKRVGFGLQPARKKGRMMQQIVEEDSLSTAPLGKTQRERSMNQEKEKQKRRTREEERKKARRLIREELRARLHKELEKEEEAESISEWIERVDSCPVFTPTKEQFEDPLKYIESLAPEVASEFGICKVIPPGCYVSRMFTGRTKFWDTDFKMEVRKQPLRMVDWDKKDTASKDVNFNKDTKLWTVKELEEWANDFVTKHYENSASMLQLRFIEREFWKEFLLRQNKSVRYASDVPGTVFDDWEALGRSKWNLGTLPTLPDSVLRIVEDGAPPIPGVTEPMLYVGMLFSMFAWHVEDQYLYSINYHHLGAPKSWYGVPGRAAQAFERVAREKVFNLPDTEEGLARTLRLLIGKTIMFPPGLLVDAGVPVCRAVQQPGEFVITFPRSYHAGFSNGFNCGEAVNFAMPDWFAYGAACTRRYRLLRQVQVVAYDELLCKEAEQLHARMHADCDAHYQPTDMDTATMVEFVRLMRWQHWQRWRLARKGFSAEPIQLVQRTSVECALCHHKNYLAYVLCDCHDGDPMCLNHPDELHACHCQAQRAPDGGDFPGPAVYYVLELPVLEAIAADFERLPGIPEKLADAARNEVDKAELKDLKVLGAAREALMGDGQPPEDGAGMRDYRRWAPIGGYNYPVVQAARAIQPGTPSQQAVEVSEGRSQESGEKSSPDREQGRQAGGSSQCLAIQTVPERLPWSPPQRAPAGSQPATPPQAVPTSGWQPPSRTPLLTAPQTLPELLGRSEEPSGVLVRAESGGAAGRGELDGRLEGQYSYPETNWGGAERAEVKVAPAASGAEAGSVEREDSAGEEVDMGGQEQDVAGVGDFTEAEPEPASTTVEGDVSERLLALEAVLAVAVGQEAAPQAMEETAAEQAHEVGMIDSGGLQVASLAPSRDAAGEKNIPPAGPGNDFNCPYNGEPTKERHPASGNSNDKEGGREAGAGFVGEDERPEPALGEVPGVGRPEDVAGEQRLGGEGAPESIGDKASAEGGGLRSWAEKPAINEAAVLSDVKEDVSQQGAMGHAGDRGAEEEDGEGGEGAAQATEQAREGVGEAEARQGGSRVAVPSDGMMLNDAEVMSSSGKGTKQGASGGIKWYLSLLSGFGRSRQDVATDYLQPPNDCAGIGAAGQEVVAGLVQPGTADGRGEAETGCAPLAAIASTDVPDNDPGPLHVYTARDGAVADAPSSNGSAGGEAVLPHESILESSGAADCEEGSALGNGLVEGTFGPHRVEGGSARSLANIVGGQTGMGFMRNVTPVAIDAESTAHRRAAGKGLPQDDLPVGRGAVVGAAHVSQMRAQHEHGNGQGQRKGLQQEREPDFPTGKVQEGTWAGSQWQGQREGSQSGNDNDQVIIAPKKKKSRPMAIGATIASRMGLDEVRASKAAAECLHNAGKSEDHAKLDLNTMPDDAMA